MAIGLASFFISGFGRTAENAGYKHITMKEAAKKLAANGYTNIVEFGGIIDCTGAIEK